MTTAARLVVTLEDGQEITAHLSQMEMSISHNVKPARYGGAEDYKYRPAEKLLSLTSRDFHFDPIRVSREDLAAAFGITPERLDEIMRRTSE